MAWRPVLQIAVASTISYNPSLGFMDGPGLGRMAQPRALTEWLAARSPLERMLIPERNVKVWLPPLYELDKSQRFPVLYVHDGQNILHDHDSWTGHSWRIGGVLSQLISARRLAHHPIVVMIDNGKRRRHMEYGDTLMGDAFLAHLCDELKPRIDGEFRCLPGPEHTAIMGSSMGGLAAFRAVWRRPDVFGNCACLSPVFQPAMVMDVTMNGYRLHKVPGGRIYIDNGGDTVDQSVRLLDLEDGMNPGYWWLDSHLQPGVEAMLGALRAHNVAHHFHREPGGRHNERGWAFRLHRPLQFLYGGKPGHQVEPTLTGS